MENNEINISYLVSELNELRQKSRNEKKKFQTLLEISSGMYYVHSLEGIGMIISDNLKRFLSDNFWGLKLGVFNLKENEYRIIYRSLNSNIDFEKISTETDGTIALKNMTKFSKIVFDIKNTLVIQNNHSDFSLNIDPDQVNLPELSLIFIPLLHQGEIVGLLSVARLPKESLDSENIDFFESIGKYSSVKMAELLNEIQKTKAISAVIETEKRYHDLVETISEWIWEVDCNGVFTFVSSKVLDILGYDPGELTGKSPFDICTPEERDFVSRVFFDSVKEKRIIRGLEHKHITKSGKIIFIETNGNPFFDLNGNLLGYRGVDHDITSRKAIEEKLLESKIELEKTVKEKTQDLIATIESLGKEIEKRKEVETELNKNQERLNLALEAGSDGIWERNILTGEIYLSPGFFRILGYQDTDILSDFLQFIRNIIHPDDVDKFFTQMSYTINNPERHYHVEVRFRSEKGDYKWLIVDSKVAELSKDGEAVRVIGTFLDITEEKKIEIELMNSEKKFSSVFNFNPACMAIISFPDGIVMDVNESYLKFINISRESIIGKSFKETGINIDIKEELIISENILANGEFIDHEIEVKLPDNTIKTGLLSGKKIQLQNQTCLIIVFQDYTEFKKNQTALIESENKLRALNQELSEIIDFLPDPTFVINNKKKVIAWNRGMEKLSGILKNDIIGTGDYSYSLPFYKEKRPLLIDLIMHPNEEIEKKYTSIKRDNNIFYAESTLQNLDGKSIYIMASASLLYNINGEVIGAIETMRDITEKKIYEQKLLDFQKELEEKVKERTYDLIAAIHKLESEIEERKKIEAELLMHRRQLEKLIQERTTSLVITNQKLELEIEERKKTVEDFEKSQVILNSIEDGVLSINKDNIIIRSNKAAENITGYKAEEIIGKSSIEFFEMVNLKITIDENVIKGKKIIDEKVQLKNSNGFETPVRLSTSLIRINDVENEVVITFRDLSQVELLRKEVEKDYSYQDIISKNPKMQQIFLILPDISQSNSAVLIEGPTGTGKELLAKAIHNLSFRKDKPYVIINCGAISPFLIESELFGHVKGAFTDAKQDKIGKIMIANGGTVFFDEIGELPINLQVKLLRLLENFEIEPIGGTKPLKVDIRIIAATNRNLINMVKNGAFREDLFYRLNTVRLYLPPLTERKEDIPYLIDHFVRKLIAKHGKKISRISPDALELLLNYSFPGNIRELEKIVEYAFIICRSDIIDIQHLPSDILKKGKLSNSISMNPENENLEIEKIMMVLKRHNGNKTLAARELKMHYTTLFRKLKKYNIPH